jgi:hypothetical protein
VSVYEPNVMRAQLAAFVRLVLRNRGLAERHGLTAISLANAKKIAKQHAASLIESLAEEELK